MSHAHRVWVCKRRTGCRKICPQCQARNTATAKQCTKCGASLREVKRTFEGKKVTYNLRWLDPRTGKMKMESAGEDKALAAHRAGLKRQELLSGEYLGTTAIGFDDFVTEHLRNLRGTLSSGTYVIHDQTLKQFRAACSPRDLTVIDFQMLEKFKAARLADDCSAATVNKALRTLQSILQQAVRRGYLRKNPFEGNRKALLIHESEPNPVVLESDEFTKLVDACPDDRWRGICAAGYYGGLRKGEIVNLEWKDIDFKNRSLRVANKPDHRTKNGKNRDVPMSKELVTALQKLQFGMFKSGYVFTNPDGGKMVNNLNRDFAVIVKRAGLVDDKGESKFSLHDLRRTFVTDLLVTGTDPKTVQELAGHANLQTTMKHYAAVRVKNLLSAIERRSEVRKIG